jgi:hypothetical protein
VKDGLTTLTSNEFLEILHEVRRLPEYSKDHS